MYVLCKFRFKPGGGEVARGVFECNIFPDSGDAAQFESDFFPWFKFKQGGGGGSNPVSEEGQREEDTQFESDPDSNNRGGGGSN